MSTTPLASVLIEGTFSGRPTAATPGRLYFATDTKRIYYDNGASWDDVTPVPPAFTGDSGSGGAAGSVPAPPAGSAAAGDVLSAGGTWAAPALPSFTEEVVTFSGTSGTLSHTPTVLLGIYRNGVRMSTLATGIMGFSITGAAVTLGTAAGGSDVFIAVYFHA